MCSMQKNNRIGQVTGLSEKHGKQDDIFGINRKFLMTGHLPE